MSQYWPHNIPSQSSHRVAAHSSGVNSFSWVHLARLVSGVDYDDSFGSSAAMRRPLSGRCSNSMRIEAARSLRSRTHMVSSLWDAVGHSQWGSNYCFYMSHSDCISITSLWHCSNSISSGLPGHSVARLYHIPLYNFLVQMCYLIISVPHSDLHVYHCILRI